jgi:hypothetical protein
MLKDALKEWAVICRALADGRQALLLRKGGIAEVGDGFQLEHTRFWLFPTYTHQQQTGIKPEAAALLEAVQANRPPAGTIRLSHFAEVAGVYVLHNLSAALILDDLHMWSAETVSSRFVYRHPGLYAMPLRVYRASQVHDLPDRPDYAGCRSWVTLDRELPTDGAEPVLSDADFRQLMRTLDDRLNPTAFV